jgi:hypothetical protein
VARFGDSPESLRCEQVGRAVEVGQIQGTAGTVEYEGESYAGVTGEGTFAVPQLAVDTYRLAESIESRVNRMPHFRVRSAAAGQRSRSAAEGWTASVRSEDVEREVARSGVARRELADDPLADR